MSDPRLAKGEHLSETEQREACSEADRSTAILWNKFHDWNNRGGR
jgi:hypothetical protein